MRLVQKQRTFLVDAETTVVDSAANHTWKAAMVAEKDRLIVLAAREHFLRDGFAAASMDAIARSAGVSVKTIYRHFTFPELGRQYQKNFARGRTGILVAYLRRIARRNSWTKRRPERRQNHVEAADATTG